MRGIAITLACFALIAALLAWSRWLARRRLASLGHAAMAAACATLAAFLWVVTGALSGFEPIRPGVAVAGLRLDAAGPGHYRATLVRLPGGRVQVFEMTGERWRIAARTLEWAGPAARLGLRPSYRLERLECGPADGTAGTATPGRVYALSEAGGVDPWTWMRAGRPGARYAVTDIADSPWQPMARGAEFTVRVAGGQVAVEPADASGPALAPSQN